jgi:large subunit ribosomal protein L30
MSAAKKAAKQEKSLRVTLIKSPIGQSYKQKQTLQALGLRRINQSVEQKDAPAIRGMVAKVSHLVTIEEVG